MLEEFNGSVAEYELMRRGIAKAIVSADFPFFSCVHFFARTTSLKVCLHVISVYLYF